MSVRAEDRNASAAARNHHMVGVNQGLDRLNLYDGYRLGRGDNTAVASSGILYDVIITLPDQLVRLLLRHEGADRFGRMEKCGILRVHLDLRKHGRNADIDSPVKHLLSHGILQVVSDVSLTHRHTDGQRNRDVVLRIRSHQFTHRVLDHADLRSVSMRDNDFISLLDQVGDRFRRFLCGRHLLRKVFAERISA